MAQSTLPYPINTPEFAFLTGQYFTVSPIAGTEQPADESVNIGRWVFTECDGLEMSREHREHYESGHSEPNIAGDKRSYNNITLKRGFAYDPREEVEGTYDELEQWYEKGTKVDLFIDIFDDQEGIGDQREPRKTYRVKAALPVRFKPWKGDANSGDTVIQELELACEKYGSYSAQ